MAVAPVLPWRKASSELLRHRLLWPAWFGVGRRRAGRRSSAPSGFAPLLAFGLGGFAAGVGRPPARAGHPPPGLAGPGRAGQRRHDRAHRRGDDRRRLRCRRRRTRSQYDVANSSRARRPASAATRSPTRAPARSTARPSVDLKADVRIDGGQVYSPALAALPASGQTIGTPSVRTGCARTCTSRSSAAPDADGSHHADGA